MIRACLFGLVACAALGMVACAESGSANARGFTRDEGIWFDANGVRVHRPDLDAKAAAAKSSASAGQCACKAKSGSVPGLSGYTRER
jgi:hypothetical protein